MNKNVLGTKMKPGDYEPRTVMKGIEETFLNIPEGGVYWLVQMDKDSQMDVKEQIDAVILSKLIRIERALKGLKK